MAIKSYFLSVTLVASLFICCAPPQKDYPSAREGRAITDASATDVRSIVICPASYAIAANALSSFHSNTEGIPSMVVTVEDIAAKYAAALNPPFTGYTNSKIEGWQNINDYNFILAKQIIAYLRDTANHPNLQYVTLLGDRMAVPPSYWGYSEKHGYWFTTDFCYTSPDYDFIPNFKVGRLSVKNASDAAFEVNKIVKWYASANWNWFRKIYLAAGEPGLPNSHYFSGEFNVLQAANQDFLSGMDVRKLFESDRTFTSAGLTSALTTPTGFVYMIGHSNGWRFKFTGDDYLNNTDVLAYPTNTECPIVVAADCISALLSAADSTYNIGEALLRSPAGAIA